MVRLTLDAKSWVTLPPWHTYKSRIIQRIRFMSLMFLCQTWGRVCVKARHKNLSIRQLKYVLFSV